MLYETIDEIEKEYFCKDIYYDQPELMITFQIGDKKFKNVINNIFNAYDGPVLDVYSDSDFGITLRECFLDESNRPKIVKSDSIGYTKYPQLRVLLRYFKRPKQDKRKPQYLLLYNKETFVNKYRKIGWLWPVTCLLLRLKPIDMQSELKAAGCDEGMRLLFEFDGYSNLNMELNRFYKAQKSGDDEQLELFSRHIYGLFFYIRDIKNAKIWYEKWTSFCKDEGKKTRHKKVWETIECLLDDVENSLSGKDDIVIQWIDALKYSDLDNMTYLREKTRSGISFENMYAPALYTHPEQRAMFCKSKLIDDKSYRITNDDMWNNSEWARLCKKHRYNKVNLSESFFPGHVSDDRLRKHRFADYPLMSSMMFIALCNLEENDDKQFILAHYVGEIHNGYRSPYNPKRITSIYENDNQIKETLKYVDEQIEWYDRFFRHIKYNIWMSDHGKEYDESFFTIENVHHTVFSICGDTVAKNKVMSTCDLLDFCDILSYLFEDKPSAITKAYSNKEGCAIVQREDPYYRMPRKITDQILQYRGIVTDSDAYVRIVNGNEYYYTNKDEQTNRIDDKEYNERIKILKEKAGISFIDIYDDERFKMTRKLYKEFGLKRSMDNEYI